MSPANRRPGRPVRPGPPDDARERLLDAATALFARQGVAGTTLAHIAAHAGVTPAMVHYYFKTRGRLIDVVAQERLAPIIAFIWEPAVAAATPQAIVPQLVERIVRAAAERPWLPTLWMREIGNEGSPLRERVLGQLPVERLRTLADLLAEGRRRGTVPAGVEPRLAFLSILGMTLLPLATASLWQRLWGETRGPDPAEVAAHATAVLTGGLFGAAAAAGPVPADTAGAPSAVHAPAGPAAPSRSARPPPAGPATPSRRTSTDPAATPSPSAPRRSRSRS